MEAEIKDKQGNPIGFRYDCSSCTDEDKIARGCEGGLTTFYGDLSIDHCPEKLMTADMTHNIGIWRRYHFHGNSFPFLGGWGEIPAALLYVIELLEGEYRLFMQRMKDR